MPKPKDKTRRYHLTRFLIPSPRKVVSAFIFFTTKGGIQHDRRRKETAPSQASTGGSAGQGSREGAKSPDATVDPRGGDFGEGLSPCCGDGSDETRRCFTRAFSVTGVGRSGRPGRSAFFYPEGRTYSPPGHRPGGGSLPGGQVVRSARRIALSAESASQCCRDCGPGHHCLREGIGSPFPSPAKTCTRQLCRRGRANPE